MKILLDWFGHPEQNFFPVLIAGTKGKGSTGFFLQSMLQEAGISSGFYSSPHLEDPRERIRINGQIISKGLWAALLDKIKTRLHHKRLPGGLGEFTYFEIMTLLAVLAFAQAKAKIGIFEVGMGGRLDAANALDARLSIITTMGMDHEAILGNTLEKITGEKAAVIRPGAHVVASPQVPEAMRVIQNQIKRQQAHYWKAEKVSAVQIGLKGDFQRINAGAALRALWLLKNIFRFPISDGKARKGLKNTDWPGRFELIRRKGTDYLLDGAHNPASIKALVSSLKHMYPSRPRILIFGTSKDKKSELMLESLKSYFKEIILTRAVSIRSQEIGVLLTQAREQFHQVFAAESPMAALALAVSKAKANENENTLVVVTGSFFLIGEVRELLCRK
jgi:dihydrofolate synthase/folylpolyglutamate synthase